jgi:hypothetical protein
MSFFASTADGAWVPAPPDDGFAVAAAGSDVPDALHPAKEPRVASVKHKTIAKNLFFIFSPLRLSAAKFVSL